MKTQNAKIEPTKDRHVDVRIQKQGDRKENVCEEHLLNFGHKQH
jgi:hypothetical protein